MWPILVSLGPVKIYAFGVFLAVGLFTGLYFWWKMGRDEHWEEIELFDAYFLSLLIFLLTSRVAYIIIHPELQTLYRSIAVLAYPGMIWGAGIAVVLVFAAWFARNHEWPGWKVVDAAVVAVAAVVAIAGVGNILNGSNPGIEHAWGLIYPGGSTRRLPVDVWTWLWGVLTFITVSRTRKQFRFYTWYKGEASVARDGLAAWVFAGLSGLYLAGAGMIDDGVRWQTWVGFGMMLLAAVAVYRRSGRRERFDLIQWVKRLRSKG